MLFSRIFAGASMLGLAAASCQLGNQLKGPPSDAYKSDKLCVPQGEGDWTFSMYTTATEVPDFSLDNPNAGFVSGFTYLIYDNTCTLRGAYAPEGNNCGIPFVIEDNFLADVLTITSEWTGVDSPYFSFLYGNGKFSIRNNHCGCQSMSHGLAAAKGCKCAFPVNGMLPTKREEIESGKYVEFEA